MINKLQKYFLNQLPTKFLKNIVIELDTGCWLWQVNINRNGYGRIYHDGKRRMAHIFMYKLFKGSYKEGLLLDHVYCKHRNCCNPTHLSPVTAQQNTHRGNAVLMKKKAFKIPVDKNPDWFSDLLAGYSYIRI